MCSTGEIVTFGELEVRANEGAHLFRKHDLRAGDHIAILMENRREFLEICFAADRSGIYYTTISTHLTFDEIAYILQDCGAQLLIVSDKYKDLLHKLLDNTHAQYHCYLVGGEADSHKEPLQQTQGKAIHNWNDAVTELPKTPIVDEAQGLDMLYSSGTTGRPKGIKWPLPNQLPGTRSMLIDLLTALYGYGPETRYLSPAPLYHAAPMRHSMVVIKMGGTAYIMDRFVPAVALELIQTHRITHSQWVPTMFVRFLKLPDDVREKYDLSSMRLAVHAAAPCPIDIKRKMIEWWGEIIEEYYSGTENNGFTSITTSEWLLHPGSVGRAKLGVLHICNEQGDEVPTGLEGEVYFENGHQFTYHNDPVKTAKCTNKVGWTSIGDIGSVDDDGYLYLTDRKSYLIISGGVNVYPQEAENTLLSHPSVLDAAVVGVPDEDFGEAVLAVVQLLNPEDVSDELKADLIAFCRERMSTIKCPRFIEFRESLPRSATGKLYKRKLKKEYWPQLAGNAQGAVE